MGPASIPCKPVVFNDQPIVIECALSRAFELFLINRVFPLDRDHVGQSFLLQICHGDGVEAMKFMRISNGNDVAALLNLIHCSFLRSIGHPNTSS